MIDGAEVIDVRGMSYLPFFNKWCWIEDTSVNFALRAIKPERSPEVMSDTQTDAETWQINVYNISTQSKLFSKKLKHACLFFIVVVLFFKV